MEENETEMQTAIREVKEETNLDVLIKNNKHYISEYYPKEDTFKQVIFFLASCENIDIKRQEEEIKNIQWFKVEDAIEKITHNNSKNILKKVVEENKILFSKNDNIKYIGKNLNDKNIL